MNIALAGYGTEGKASYEYWNRDGNVLTIVSESEVTDAPEGVATISGEGAFDKLGDFDLVVRSPGINPRKLPYGDKVWSATNEFFERCTAPIIGVTGTKGKGTTSSLIASILKAAGKNVHLVGNIGMPALSELANIGQDDIVVYELSSFQLWDAKKSPQIAVVLGIEPDHLDVHDDMDDYVEAKANIRRFQSLQDDCVYHPTNQLSRRIAGVRLAGFDADQYGGSIEFAHRYGVKEEDEVYVENGHFKVQDRDICSVDYLKLPGRHNVENACAAISAVSSLMDWPEKITDEHVKRGLEAFTGLPHRLKFVAEKNGVKYYDDSIATTPGSAIAALASFSEPKIIILGGHDKGADYSELIESCAESAATVVAIGSNGPRIAELCRESGVAVTEVEEGMAVIVEEAAKIAQSDSVVILSPAAASFDMFKGYADRGDQFADAVNDL